MTTLQICLAVLLGVPALWVLTLVVIVCVGIVRIEREQEREDKAQRSLDCIRERYRVARLSEN